MKTLDLCEAARFLRMHPDTLQRRAAAGEIPGAKPGKCWVFIDEDLADWMRSLYKEGREKPNSGGGLSASETVIGSPRRQITEGELFALLAPAKRSKRRAANKA